MEATTTPAHPTNVARNRLTDLVGDIESMAADIPLLGDDSDGEMFGLERLEQVLCSCAADAKEVIDTTVKAVNNFTDFAPARDDRTLVVGLLS